MRMQVALVLCWSTRAADAWQLRHGMACSAQVAWSSDGAQLAGVDAAGAVHPAALRAGPPRTPPSAALLCSLWRAGPAEL
jgi:hypothetical protein